METPYGDVYRAGLSVLVVPQLMELVNHLGAFIQDFPKPLTASQRALATRDFRSSGRLTRLDKVGIFTILVGIHALFCASGRG